MKQLPHCPRRFTIEPAMRSRLTPMKHILVFMIMILVTANLYAQTEHVRFIGIPLDGTIQQYQEELTAKGYSHDQETSAFLPKGVRAFRGPYAGHDALLIIFHDETTNVVYQAKAVITCQDEETCEAVFNEINGQLQEEYGTLLSTKSIQYGHESYGYTILSDQRVVIGDIGLFVTKDENSPNGFLVQVQCTDTANMRIHEQRGRHFNCVKLMQ